jgi:hypothetical protein
MHSWNTFGARTSHEQTWTHKTHHGSNLGEAATFPLIVYSMPGHKTSTQMSFCPRTHSGSPEIPKIRTHSGSPEIPKIKIPTELWRPITLCVDLRLRWSPKQSCSLCWELFNGMWHVTCTQGNQSDSQLLVVGSQIGNLTFGPSFVHNLCFRYLNGSWKAILDIYVLRSFQWYKKIFNPMSLDPCNCLLKIRESIGTLTPKVETHLGMWGFIPSHSFAFPGAWNVTLGFTSGSHLCKVLPWSRAQG